MCGVASQQLWHNKFGDMNVIQNVKHFESDCNIKSI